MNSDTNHEWRAAMNTPPVMAVANPYDFYEQIQALSPDPLTKKTDPEKIKVFLAAHPESQAFNDWKATYKPTNSFATEMYHSINAFYLIDKSGHKQPVRWVAVPQAIEQDLPKLDSESADALQIQLSKILENNSIKFDMVFTLANDQDDENNPTIPWPKDRKKVTAGTLNITSWEVQQTGKCGEINFDPLVLPDGIAATEDPILRARGAAYAESYRRRVKETLLGAKESSTTHSRSQP
jgi:catalase